MIHTHSTQACGAVGTAASSGCGCQAPVVCVCGWYTNSGTPDLARLDKSHEQQLASKEEGAWKAAMLCAESRTAHWALTLSRHMEAQYTRLACAVWNCFRAYCSGCWHSHVRLLRMGLARSRAPHIPSTHSLHVQPHSHTRQGTLTKHLYALIAHGIESLTPKQHIPKVSSACLHRPTWRRIMYTPLCNHYLCSPPPAPSIASAHTHL